MSITPGRGKKRKNLQCLKPMTQKSKSLRTQHSISLHIPKDELSSGDYGMNCYIDLPQQVFSLTYIHSNETNPDSLTPLDYLMNIKWQAYRVGFLYNMDYKPKTLKALKTALDNELKRKMKFRNVGISFNSAVTVVDDLSPTENDNQALKIKIIKCTVDKEFRVYEAFILSWCNPNKQKDTFLPLMLCNGAFNIKAIVNSVLQDRHGVNIIPLVLPQDDFLHLTTYCTIILDEVDDYEVTTSYKIPPGTIKLSASVPTLLRVWKSIHEDESNEVDLDEILRYKSAMELFYESVYGLKLGRANYVDFTIKHFCSIHTKGLLWFNSTKTIHVVLKYLNYFIAQQLKLRVLNYMEDSNSM